MWRLSGGEDLTCGGYDAAPKCAEFAPSTGRHLATAGGASATVWAFPVGGGKTPAGRLPTLCKPPGPRQLAGGGAGGGERSTSRGFVPRRRSGRHAATASAAEASDGESESEGGSGGGGGDGSSAEEPAMVEALAWRPSAPGGAAAPLQLACGAASGVVAVYDVASARSPVPAGGKRGKGRAAVQPPEAPLVCAAAAPAGAGQQPQPRRVAGLAWAVRGPPSAPAVLVSVHADGAVRAWEV
jgi:hypothetical protein